MSAITVYGLVADRDGLAWSETIEQGPTRPELRSRFWATPAERVASVHDAIPINVEHGPNVVGELVHMERDEHGRLWAVGTVRGWSPFVVVDVAGEAVPVATDYFWSPERSPLPDEITFSAIALTTNPARISAAPVRILPGELDNTAAADRHAWALRRGSSEHGLLERAAHARFERLRSRGPLVVQDLRQRQLGTAEAALFNENRRPVGRWRHTPPYRGLIAVR